MKNLILFIIFSILLVFAPLSTFPQEKEATLEPIVVTATRDVQEVRKVPANVTVISKEEIEQSNAKTVIELIRNEMGIVVRDVYGTGKTASVDIRGFGETGPLNSLVLVDGRRVNEIDLSGVDWSQIPLDQVERIEIVRGPGSVLYGDNAVGGVINIITKKPEKPFSMRAEVTGGSYHFNKESASVGGKWGGLSALLNASYSGTEGYRDNGFFRAKDAGGKITYDLNEFLSLNFSGSLHRDDAGLPGELPRDIYKLHRRRTLRPDDKAETEDGYALFGIKANLGEFGRIETDLSLRDREVKDFFTSFNFRDERNLRTWGFTPRYILEKQIFNRPNKLIFGFDLYRSKSEIESETSFFGLTFFNESEVMKRSKGIYLNNEFSILDNLVLSLGYRHEWVNYEFFQETPRLKDKTSDNEPAFNISLDYLFGKRSSAFLSYKRSFRFPVSDELLQFFPVVQINPAMKPQRGYHYEGGIRHFFNEKIEANITLFWIDLKNEIFFNPLTFANENYEETRRQGIETGVKINPFPWLSIWGNYSYIRPLLRGGAFSGSEIPSVSRHKGTLGTDIDLGRGFTFNARANFFGPRRFISDWANQIDRLGEYYTLDTKLSFAYKGFKAFVGINNMFDRKYAEYAVIDALGNRFYYPSPERNFIGGISYTF